MAVSRISAFFLALIAIPTALLAKDPPPKKPNFLVVLVDDMGWSDVGAFGGEINTPNLDRLAKRGSIMTNFYVAPTCSPTRSMLMTGVDNHLAGVGTMSGFAASNQRSRNYAAQLHKDVVTVAEALKQTGYQTIMSGKWHLAIDADQEPHNRGFDRSFALLNGGTSHFSNKLPINPGEVPTYQEDGKPIELPAAFYSTYGYTDKILEYLNARDPEKPFFAYLAYTAPHDPLQVPADWVDRYRGRFDSGPENTRQARLQRQVERGLIPENTKLWELPNGPDWLPSYRKPWTERSEEERGASTKPMEIYASMIEIVDQQLGRVLTALEESGELENTYVIFFSDNGASAVAPLVYPGNTNQWLAKNWDMSLENPGTKDAFTVLGAEWANVAVTPFRLFKAQVGEGGIRSPLIVAGQGIPAGGRIGALGHVMDIAPTLYDLAGLDSASSDVFSGKIRPQGYSLLPIWTGEGKSVRQSFATELFDNRALRSGDWKISYINPPQGSGKWELYNLKTDPGETVNVAGNHPEKRDELLVKYAEYAKANGVIVPSEKFRISLRQTYAGKCDADCDRKFEEFENQLR